MVILSSDPLSDPLRLVAYCVLAAACFAAAYTAERRSGLVLMGVGVLAIFLGLALTLDVAGAVADAVRRMAGDEGWYGSRRPIQGAVIIVVAALGLTAAVSVWIISTRLLPELRTMLVLLMGLICFLVIRAISLHHVDAYLNRHPGGQALHLGDIIELVAIFALTLAVTFARVPQRSASLPDAT